MQLEKFGVNVDDIKKLALVPERLFRCWIKDWEEPLLKNNDAVAKIRLLQKYGGLVIKDVDEDIVYTIST